MALNPKHVYAPTPIQSSTVGAVAVATEGTTAPTDATSALSASWDSGGYVSEDGISITVNRSTTPIRDWSKGAVRNLLTEFGGSISIGFLQVDEFSAQRVFGASNVTTTAATSVKGELIKVEIGAELPPIESWCFNMKDGDARIRVYVPRGQITDVSQMDFKPDAGHVIGGTLQCYANADGDSIIVFYDDGTKLSA